MLKLFQKYIWLIFWLSNFPFIKNDICIDFVPEGETKWYDSDGAYYDCFYYVVKAESCGTDGLYYENFGHNAQQACCGCGGGQCITECTQCIQNAPDPTECLECDASLYRVKQENNCACFTGYIEENGLCKMDCDSNWFSFCLFKECLYQYSLRGLCSSCDDSLNQMLVNYQCVCKDGYYYYELDNVCQFCDTESNENLYYSEGECFLQFNRKLRNFNVQQMLMQKKFYSLK